MAVKDGVETDAEDAEDQELDEDDESGDGDEDSDSTEKKKNESEASFRKRIAQLRKQRNSIVAENKRLKASLAASSKSAATDEQKAKALREEVRAELSFEFGKKLARTQAVNVLNKAGYRGNSERGARQIDLDDVVSEDGTIDSEALEEAVDTWKSEEPSLFRRSRKATDDEDDDDDSDDEPRTRQRASGNGDLGRRSRKRVESNPLLKTLTDLVG